MPTFPRVHGIRHFEVTKCSGYNEYGDDVRVVYQIRANEKLTTLIKRLIKTVEGYTSYHKFHGNELVVIVSCRGYEIAGETEEEMEKLLDQVAVDFGRSLMETLQTELNSRSADTPQAVETEEPKQPTTLPDDEAFIYRNQGRFAKRLSVHIPS